MNKCAVLFIAVSSLLAASRAAETDISLLENNVLRARVNQLPANFAEQLRAAEPTNPIAGTILDLRFADGTAAVATDYFAREKSPVVILVNSQTRGTAAALATQLRAAVSAIIIGSTNPPGTIMPDIALDANLDDERTLRDNPYATPVTNRATAISATNSLLAFVDHTSEAELVRKRVKDGEETGDHPTPRAVPAQPFIRDPALARAVDLLKALAILRQSRG